MALPDTSKYTKRINDQFAFTLDVARLIAFIANAGFVVTLGEAARTIEQQKIHFKNGRSKTLKSKHIDRLAIDLNIFKDGVLCGYDDTLQIGEYWESLSPENVWGGRWKTIVDTPHFQRGK
jgi:hypothetical protein